MMQSDAGWANKGREGRAVPSFGAGVVEWHGSTEADAPLIVLLHGWGETEADMVALVPSLPVGLTYASLRGPLAMGRHPAWFAPGHPFHLSAQWFEAWLNGVASPTRPVVLVGFSAGAAFAGGLLLLNPGRYAGAAILYGTLPFEAGVATPPGGLAGIPVFVAHGTNDAMIPRDLLDRAWTYLTQDSGASARAVLYEDAHGVSERSLADLAHWITEVTTGQTP